MKILKLLVVLVVLWAPVRAAAAAEPEASSAVNAPRQETVVIEGMTVTRKTLAVAAGPQPVLPLPGPSCEFDKICAEAMLINGVRQITYEQFVKLRATKEKFALVDVLSSDDYNTGHIPGAISFPVKTINLYNAVNKIPMGSNVVVYCLDYHCPYSGEAAQKLASYGYKVLAYEGGLDEWQQKGNALQR